MTNAENYESIKRNADEAHEKLKRASASLDLIARCVPLDMRAHINGVKDLVDLSKVCVGSITVYAESGVVTTLK